MDKDVEVEIVLKFAGKIKDFLSSRTNKSIFETKE